MLTYADQIIAFADVLRRSALARGADVNDANLFVHDVLMQALAAGAYFDYLDADTPEFSDALADFAPGLRANAA